MNRKCWIVTDWVDIAYCMPESKRVIYRENNQQDEDSRNKPGKQKALKPARNQNVSEDQ
jgi:hypothetical protein